MTALLGLIWMIAGHDSLVATVQTDDYGGLSGWGLAFFITIALDIASGHRTGSS
jgi:hypothetical protein